MVSKILVELVEHRYWILGGIIVGFFIGQEVGWGLCHG